MMHQKARVAAMAALVIGIAGNPAMGANGGTLAAQSMSQLPPPSTTTSPQDDAAIRAFLDEILGGYADGAFISPIEQPDRFFDPRLAAGISALVTDAETNGTFHDALGADPICGCQDFGDFSHQVRWVAAEGMHGTAIVDISNFGTTTTRTMHLMRTDEGWRISEPGGDFRASVLGDAAAY